MFHQCIFKGNRTDPFTARFNDILTPVFYFYAAIFADGSDIPGLKPAIVSKFPCLSVFSIIGRGYKRTTYFQLTHCFSIPRYKTKLVPSPYLYERNREPLFYGMIKLL